MKITNLVLWVQENKLSEKFYKKLGFDVVRSDDEVSTVKLGEFWLDLVSMRDEPPFTGDSMAGTKGGGMYIYINVPDVDLWHAELCTRGFAPATEPRDWPWGNREFILKDPDGYKVCFWQKTSER